MIPSNYVFNPGLVQISGSRMESVHRHVPVTASYAGTNNLRRKYRDKFTKLVTGQLHMIDVGESPIAGGNPVTIPATVPSTANRYIDGQTRAFVSRIISGSHETHDLNCYSSGSQALENSPVPASATLWYEKQSRFNTKTYKVSASFETTGSYVKLAGTGSITTTASFLFPSGTFLVKWEDDSAIHNVYSQQVWAIPISVPDSGFLQDIKVWVEIITDTKNNAGTNLPSGSAYGNGLGSLMIGLRSPSVKGFYGVPSWNNPRLPLTTDASTNIGGVSDPRTASPGTGALGNQESPLTGLFRFYQDTFILWDSGQYFDFTNGQYYAPRPGIGGAHDQSACAIDNTVPVWDSDRHIRTIFSDSSTTANPRHMNSIFVGTSQSLPESVLSGAAPCVAGGALTGANQALGFGLAWGSQYPWICDPRIPGLNQPQTTGSVPPGWLTGPNGGPAPGEFFTSGSSLGPNTIKPVYPLLDAVTEYSYFPSGSFNFNPIAGSRPGLRGSQINGVWWLLVAEKSAHPSNGPGLRPGCWFRQARLEITYRTGYGQTSTMISKTSRFRKPNVGIVPREIYTLKDAPVYASTGSGVNSYDGIGRRHNTTKVFADTADVYGRAFGITDNTGSSPDFAVFSRLTGALADRFAASASLLTGGTAHALYSYLNNPFRTPFIPISSGSSVPTSFQYFDTTQLDTKKIVSEVLRPRPIFSKANRISDVISRLGGAMRKVDSMNQKIFEAQQAALSGSS